jgi:hypothetical protein
VFARLSETGKLNLFVSSLAEKKTVKWPQTFVFFKEAILIFFVIHLERKQISVNSITQGCGFAG